MQSAEPIVVENARIDVRTGFATYSDGSPVAETRFLRTGRNVDLKQLPLQPETPTETTARRLVLAHNASFRNYFHWLSQTVFAAWEHAQQPWDGSFVVLPSLSGVQRRSLDLAGLDQTHRLELPTDSRVSTPEATILPRAFAFGAKTPSSRLAEFAMDIIRRADGAAPSPDKVYISRRDSTRRVMQNEAALEEALKMAGFHIAVMTGQSFDNQVRLLRNADTIIAPHGAGLTNVIFAKPGARVIELTPETYVNECFLRLSNVMGHRHLIETFPVEKAAARHDVEWRVDIGSVLTTLISMPPRTSTPVKPY